MAEFPDFKTIEDFCEWANAVPEKEVHNWTAKDWNKMYEKLNEVVCASPEIDKIFKERYPDARAWTQETIEKMKKRIFLEKQDNIYALGRLNQNYRFEKSQFDAIRRYGRQAGEKLSECFIDAAPLYLMQGGGRDATLRLTTDVAQEIVYEQSNIPQALEAQNKARYALQADVITDYSAGTAYAANGSEKPKIVLGKLMRDDNINVLFHEAAHAHLQHYKNLDGMQDVMPTNWLDEDFHKLLQNNSDYYISGEMVEKDGRNIMEIMKDPLIDRKLQRSVFLNELTMYSNEPMERFSRLYGTEAERGFRHLTGQTSERNAMRVLQILNAAPMSAVPPPVPVDLSDPLAPKMLAQPQRPLRDMLLSARHTEDGILLSFNAADVPSEEILKTVQNRFAWADDDLKKALNIHLKTCDAPGAKGCVEVTIPRNYEFGVKLDKFLATPPPPPPLPPLPLTAKEKVTPDAEHEVQKSAGGAADKMEQKIAAKGAQSGAHTTVKTVEKSAAGVGAKLAEANAKFDKTVDKIVEKGADTLNKTKAGKAYEKAVATVAESKAGQAVSKTADKAITKVAETAAGKAVGKAVGKAAGSAVGKSVLKKVPIIGIGAGLFFATERAMAGEWTKAGAEVASGVVGTFPGLGTAAGVAIDAALAADDVAQVMKADAEGNGKTDAMSVLSAKEKKQAAHAVSRFNACVDRRNQNSKQTADMLTTKVQNNWRLLQKWQKEHGMKLKDGVSYLKADTAWVFEDNLLEFNSFYVKPPKGMKVAEMSKKDWIEFLSWMGQQKNDISAVLVNNMSRSR